MTGRVVSYALTGTEKVDGVKLSESLFGASVKRRFASRQVPVTYGAGHLHLQQHLQVLFARALRPLFPRLLLRFGAHAVQENEKLAASAQHARRRPRRGEKKARRRTNKQANKQTKKKEQRPGSPLIHPLQEESNETGGRRSMLAKKTESKRVTRQISRSERRV